MDATKARKTRNGESETADALSDRGLSGQRRWTQIEFRTRTRILLGVNRRVSAVASTRRFVSSGFVSLVALYPEIRTLTQELMREKMMERTMAAPTARVAPMKVPMTQFESWR